MPFEISWYREGRIVGLRYYGNITLDDLKAATKAFADYVEKGTPPVHSLADVREVNKYPVNLHQIAAAINRGDPNRVGWTVIVTSSTPIRFISTAIGNLIRSKVRAFATLEAALDYLREVDPTLADVIPKDDRD